MVFLVRGPTQCGLLHSSRHTGVGEPQVKLTNARQLRRAAYRALPAATAAPPCDESAEARFGLNAMNSSLFGRYVELSAARTERGFVSRGVWGGETRRILTAYGTLARTTRLRHRALLVPGRALGVPVLPVVVRQEAMNIPLARVDANGANQPFLCRRLVPELARSSPGTANRRRGAAIASARARPSPRRRIGRGPPAPGPSPAAHRIGSGRQDRGRPARAPHDPSPRQASSRSRAGPGPRRDCRRAARPPAPH